MIIYTVCTSCKKAISADLRHKEVVLIEPKIAAIIQCEYCRNQMDLHLAIEQHGAGVMTWTDR